MTGARLHELVAETRTAIDACEGRLTEARARRDSHTAVEAEAELASLEARMRFILGNPPSVVIAQFDGKESARFACGRCGLPEAFRARDNRAVHAHLCAGHYFDLPVEERSKYGSTLALEPAARER